MVKCQVCKKEISGKALTLDGKKFGSQKCRNKYEKSMEKGVCEFC